MLLVQRANLFSHGVTDNEHEKYRDRHSPLRVAPSRDRETLNATLIGSPGSCLEHSNAVSVQRRQPPPPPPRPPPLWPFPILLQLELLLVTWGLCFIAATSQSPTYKGRDFAQPIKKGQDIVSRKRRRSSTRTTSLESEGGAEEQPYWITSGRDAHDASGRSCPAVPPVSGNFCVCDGQIKPTVGRYPLSPLPGLR